MINRRKLKGIIKNNPEQIKELIEELRDELDDIQRSFPFEMQDGIRKAFHGVSITFNEDTLPNVYIIPVDIYEGNTVSQFLDSHTVDILYQDEDGKQPMIDEKENKIIIPEIVKRVNRAVIDTYHDIYKLYKDGGLEDGEDFEEEFDED